MLLHHHCYSSPGLHCEDETIFGKGQSISPTLSNSQKLFMWIRKCWRRAISNKPIRFPFLWPVCAGAEKGQEVTGEACSSRHTPQAQIKTPRSALWNLCHQAPALKMGISHWAFLILKLILNAVLTNTPLFICILIYWPGKFEIFLLIYKFIQYFVMLFWTLLPFNSIWWLAQEARLGKNRVHHTTGIVDSSEH